MPPISPPQTPRVIVYHQTHHTREGQPVSILPLLPNCTHVIVAALHLNDPPGNITLNDHPPTHPRNHTLWAETQVLRATGIKILALLGGAAQGSFTRLDLDDATFESYYIPLRDLIRSKQLDGLDLDVEEPMTLAGVIRLIDRLKLDFGPDFIITLAPVAAALMSDRPEHNLSGFDYEALEVYRGSQIAWYNTQFYCGWGDVSTTQGYEAIVARGYPPNKVVVGMVTNPGNGSGWVDLGVVTEVLISLRTRFGPAFGGVMGWEYFNSLPGDLNRPWEWAAAMKAALEGRKPPSVPLATKPLLQPVPLVEQHVVGNKTTVVERDEVKVVIADRDMDARDEALLPESFEYLTDGSLDA
jgi:hypothetical protein